MARERMVTRAIIGTQVVALCFDATQNTCVQVETLIAGVFTKEEKLSKKLHEVLDTDTLTFVKVVSKEQVSTLYGMSEDTFITYSKVLDPVTRRVASNNTTAEETETI